MGGHYYRHFVPISFESMLLFSELLMHSLPSEEEEEQEEEEGGGGGGVGVGWRRGREAMPWMRGANGRRYNLLN